jgi:hypothetical protein
VLKLSWRHKDIEGPRPKIITYIQHRSAVAPSTRRSRATQPHERPNISHCQQRLTLHDKDACHVGQLQNGHWPQSSSAATSRTQEPTVPSPNSELIQRTATEPIYYERPQQSNCHFKQVPRRHLRQPSPSSRRFRKPT